ncbi:MAG: Rrf2 family transcriptional regulator [Acidobacteria bacterium]|nr:Rrf2 family transcriptional regulator [Acidobacteriota bacterium]
MKITYKSDYALKAVLDLALCYEGREPVSIHDTARRIDAPVKFLEQIFSGLKAYGIIESRRGSNGGYLLARAPEKITVGEIIRLIEGPTEPISCVKQDYTGCDEMYTCVFRNIWKDVHEATSRVIDRVNFRDLAIQYNSVRNIATFSI